jgi:hypothetical protein|tara:strand:- start:369 stop:512 length:144 start_codon:yes stop_codon:yes gene_type:complete
MKNKTALENKIDTLIAVDIALYKAEIDKRRINYYNQMAKSLKKPLTK